MSRSEYDANGWMESQPVADDAAGNMPPRRGPSVFRVAALVSVALAAWWFVLSQLIAPTTAPIDVPEAASAPAQRTQSQPAPAMRVKPTARVLT